MLAGDGADQEQAQAGTLDADSVAAGDAVEALEDAFLLARGKPEAGVGDGEGQQRVLGNGDGTDNVDAVGRVLDSVVQDVEDRGAEIFLDAPDVKADGAGYGVEADGIVRDVVAQEGDRDAVLNQRGELDQGAVAVAAAVAQFAGLQHLLDGGQQSVGVGVHGSVEVLALGFGDVSALQGFEIQADGGDRRFELVGDRVDEGVLALVAADFANQEDGVEHHAGHQQAEQQDAEDQRKNAAFMQEDVVDVEIDGDADEDRPQGDRKGNGAAASGDVHTVVKV